MPYAVIERIYIGEESYIKKRITSNVEIEVLEYLKGSDLSVPNAFDVQVSEDMGIFLFMEDVGQDHLEICPELYTEAIENVIKIRDFHLDTSEASITTDSLKQVLLRELDLEKICKVFGWDQLRNEFLKGIWNWVCERGTFGERLVFSHGDYHPRNLMVRNGKVITIDWEKAGYHSIFQDIYALLHMSYPDRAASLTPYYQQFLFKRFANKLGIQDKLAGYHTFLILNRLNELVCVSKDLQNEIRSVRQLLMQSEAIYFDMERRFKRKN